MTIAIISDIHDNLVNLEKCLSWCDREKIGRLICCGDVANSETLGELAFGFKNEIYLVQGNREIYDEAELRQYGNIKYYGRIGIDKIESKKVGICHEPFLIDEILKKDGKLDFIFYGHTHKPWMEERDKEMKEMKDLKEMKDRGGKKGNEGWGKKIILLNPGTLGGVFYKACFAVWDAESGELELKILEEMG